MKSQDMEKDMTKFYWSSEGLNYALSDGEKKGLRNVFEHFKCKSLVIGFIFYVKTCLTIRGVNTYK